MNTSQPMPRVTLSDLGKMLDGEERNSPAAIFEAFVGRDGASTVYNSLHVAAERFYDHAAEFRGLATAIACDGAEVPMMNLNGATLLAIQFETQALDTLRVMAFLTGDHEDDEDDEDDTLNAWPASDTAPCVEDGEHHSTQRHPLAECPTYGEPEDDEDDN